MNFTKMHGAGNDFVVVKSSDMNQDWSQMAISMCDRHFGIGGDGLLVLLPSDRADFQMREFNPDGSEAEACGNGLRCLAKYALHERLVNTRAHQVLIETAAGVRMVRISKAGNKITNIQVSMGEPIFSADNIPVALEAGKGKLVDIKPLLNYTVSIVGRELSLNLISMGNPHAVCFEQYPVSDFPLSQIGPRVERHKIFPNRANFEIARVIDRRQIEARVWERGVGETLACGSGACAVAVAARLHGYIDDNVAIELPGGILNVEWDGTGEVSLDGPAEVVFTGEWPDEE